MRIFFFISSLLLITATSCKDTKKLAENKLSQTAIAQNIKESKGYKLMEQKCFICHFPVPDGSRRNEMIAPPMLRVQEHYKPLYPIKEDFVSAVKLWIKEPSEDKIQMPGAARKFGIMPYLPYPDEEIQQIAETLFEINFSSEFKRKGRGQGHRHGRGKSLQLNNGKKWQLNKEAVAHVNGIINKLDTFNSNDVKAYQNLGKEVFSVAKKLLLDKTVENDKFNQLQAFFHDVEGDMHELMLVETTKEGQKLHKKLKEKFEKFLNFFE